MKSDEIILSPNHGLNPSISKCPICHKEIGIILFGKMKNDIAAPHYVECELCDDCRKEYTIIHEVDEFDGKVQYTGRIVYYKRKFITEELRNYNDVAMNSDEFEQLIKQCNEY